MSRVYYTIMGVVSYKVRSQTHESSMDDSSATESNSDDKPVTVLRSALLATKEKYYNDSSSQDTGDQVKEKASKDKKQQSQ